MAIKELEKRVFIAIGFSIEVKQYLSKIQKDLKAQCKSGNFSHAENLHLTLRFIGNTDAEGIDKLKTVIDEVASNSRTFEITISGLGQFPSHGKYIIWVGIQHNRELELLYNCLQNALEAAGYPKENRRYTPHVTLAREVVPKSFITDILDAVNTYDNVKMKVDRIYFIQSTRIDGRLKYIPLHTSKFYNAM